MRNESLARIEQALCDVASQSDLLRQKIEEYLFRDSVQGNRRLTTVGSWFERRQRKRRSTLRATPERRTLSDRRWPLGERLKEWESKLSQVLEKSIELRAFKQRFRA